MLRSCSRRAFSLGGGHQVRSMMMMMMSTGTPGEGAGKGGGAGGTIRESGGSMGKREAALEDQYFHNLQKKQLDELKKTHEEEIAYHEAEIRRHQDAVKRHQSKMDQLK